MQLMGQVASFTGLRKDVAAAKAREFVENNADYVRYVNPQFIIFFISSHTELTTEKWDETGKQFQRSR